MSVRKTTEQFVDELQVINPSIKALSGHGCPICGYERQKKLQRHSNEEFLTQLRKISSDIDVLDKYVNNHTKIRFQCKICGKQWKTVPNSILSGHGCPSCARSSTSFLEQVILNVFTLILGKDAVLSRDRDLIGMELDIVIPSLKIAYEPGSWAWHYNRKSRDTEKRKRCIEKGYQLIIIYTDYKKDTLPFETNCHARATSLGNSNWCETKAFVNSLLSDQGLRLEEEKWEDVRSLALEKSRRKTNEEYLAELRLINPKIQVIGEYRDNSTKVRYECSACGKKWMAMPGSVLSGHGCPSCGSRRSAERTDGMD